MKPTRPKVVGHGPSRAAHCGANHLGMDCGDGGSGATAAGALLRLQSCQLLGSALPLPPFSKHQQGTAIRLPYQSAHDLSAIGTPRSPALHDDVVRRVPAEIIVLPVTERLPGFPPPSMGPPKPAHRAESTWRPLTSVRAARGPVLAS